MRSYPCMPAPDDPAAVLASAHRFQALALRGAHCGRLTRGAALRDACAQVAPLAAAFVGYVVFWNLSLQMNSVGFYQLSKIMVLPTVAALEVGTAAA